MTKDTTPMPSEEVPGREQTDESLRAEREKADLALEQQRALDRDADRVVDRAREEADAVLDVARDKADQLVVETASGALPEVAQQVIEVERSIEDERLRVERARADARLRREREEHARALAKLLPQERDKTDRYLFVERERADEAIAKRDDFLGMVSHDLRDLLGGIVLSGELLAARGAVHRDEAIKDATARIRRYSARMNRLIGDLLDVASIDAGKLEMVSAFDDGAALITEAVDAFRANAEGKGITLEMDVPGGALLADFDHDRILQVFANLVTNAIKFTPSGGRICVSGALKDGELLLSVSDTGIGMPPDQLTDVFERFWQVGTNDRRGLGLGLYISRCIVEAHGGRIWAESEPGRGTRICFTLPAGR